MTLFSHPSSHLLLGNEDVLNYELTLKWLSFEQPSSGTVAGDGEQMLLEQTSQSLMIYPAGK